VETLAGQLKDLREKAAIELRFIRTGETEERHSFSLLLSFRWRAYHQRCHNQTSSYRGDDERYVSSNRGRRVFTDTGLF
jgi:hypothetical protein